MCGIINSKEIIHPSEVIPLKKSVYSLVLMDDVIKAVDREAYKRGTSRSDLINQILAEQLSCVTPEMRMREIFGSVAELISSSFHIQQQRSASLMTLRTALEYKYRPTINYKVELERVPSEYIGTLRVQIRTQSSVLKGLFNSFFTYRAGLESSALAALGRDDYLCELSDGCFSRRLINPSLDPEQTGEAISCYVKDLDRSVQTYFAAPHDFQRYAPELAKDYTAMLERFIL